MDVAEILFGYNLPQFNITRHRTVNIQCDLNKISWLVWKQFSHTGAGQRGQNLHLT